MKDRFVSYHPLVNFLYFAMTMGFSMTIGHPLTQGMSFLCACCYGMQTRGKEAVLFCLKWCLPMMLLTAFMNPAFSHEGVTVLLYFPTGNPLTLESILYGLSAGLSLGTLILWFFNFNRVITSDKFIYLFGRVIPALSLVLSMTLRFIPRFKAQLEQVKDAQRGMGRDPSQGSLLQRTKSAITILSILITWALENAIETGDSMRSRGYGLKGRTAFTVYRLDHRDKTAMTFLGFCGLYLLSGVMVGAFGFRYYPSVRYVSLNPMTLSFQLVFLMLCAMPVAINAVEERRWKAMHSNM